MLLIIKKLSFCFYNNDKEICSSRPHCTAKLIKGRKEMFVDLINTLPFSTFCVATGLNSKFISFWSFSFFSFSNFFKSSVFFVFPPLLTWCCTCWINRCCFAPFLFFKPNVLSCRNKYIWIKNRHRGHNTAYLDIKIACYGEYRINWNKLLKNKTATLKTCVTSRSRYYLS